MFAAVSSLAGSDLELAARRFHDVDREIKLPSRLGLWFARFQLSYMQWAMARQLTKDAEYLNDTAIWFTGLSRTMMDESAEVGSVCNDVIVLIDRVKMLINENRRLKQELRAEIGDRATQALSQAMDFNAAASARLFEAFEEHKWTLLELQASHSPRLEGYAASTPEDVAALFGRIKSEA